MSSDARTSRTGRRLTRLVLGIVVSALAIWVTFAAAGGVRDAIDALRDISPLWLVPAVVAEAVSYVFLGLQLRRLAGPAAGLSHPGAVQLGLVVFGFGLLTPASPAEGVVIAGAELHRRGLSRRRAGLALGFTEWFSLRAFFAVASVNLLVAIALGDDPIGGAWSLVAALVVIGALAATALLVRRRETAERVAVVLGWLRFWRPRLPVPDRRAAGAAWHADAMAAVGTPRNRLTLVAVTVGAMLADASCFWFSLAAAGVTVRFDVLLLATTAGSLSTWIPGLPGGIGVAEAVMPAVLHQYGVPFDAALAGALLYRAIGTFLPAMVGALALLALRNRRVRPRP